jgi:hypothetical protein
LHQRIYDTIYNKIRDKKLKYSEYLTEYDRIRELDTLYKPLSDEKLAELLLPEKKPLIHNFLLYVRDVLKCRTYLILDNVDDWPKEAVQRAIDVCRNFKDTFGVNAIIALRDYWTPRNLKLTDYNYASLLLSNPDFYEIIKRRLELAIPDGNKGNNITFPLHKGGTISISRSDIKDIYMDLITQIHINKKLQKILFEFSNCNMREYIKCIFYFFHSIHLNTKSCYLHVLSKKLNARSADFPIVEKREILFHDFIEHQGKRTK